MGAPSEAGPYPYTWRLTSRLKGQGARDKASKGQGARGKASKGRGQQGLDSHSRTGVGNQAWREGVHCQRGGVAACRLGHE
jgi:hypothetical protein